MSGAASHNEGAAALMRLTGDPRLTRPTRASNLPVNSPGADTSPAGGSLGGGAPLPLTWREDDALRAIALRIRRFGYSPSFEEIGADCGQIVKSSVSRLVGRLAAKGWVRWCPGRARSIELLRRPPPEVFLVVSDPEARLVRFECGRS